MAPEDALIHPKKIDLKDTNVALIGSDLDHKVKHASAATEPAWNDGRIGVQPGLFVWRIEDFAVVAVPKEQVGTFFEGDSYVVLHSAKPASTKQSDSDGAKDKLVHDIFFWLGAHTSQDEAGTAAYKTVELDEFLGGAAAQHREVQGAVSNAFAVLFPRRTIRRGGVATGFRHVRAGEAEEEDKRFLTLLRVFKEDATPTSGPPAAGHPARHAGVVVHEVEPSWRSLDEADVFVLDVGDKIWVWQGRHSGPMEKARAAQVVSDLTAAKHLDVEVVAQSEGRSRRVVDLLGGGGGDAGQTDGYKSARPTVSAAAAAVHRGASSSGRPRRLFKLTDESGRLSFELVKEGAAISTADLEGNDVFILDDAGKEIWVWEGRDASKAEKAQWLRVTQAYIAQLQERDENAHLTPMAKVVQGRRTLPSQKQLPHTRVLLLVKPIDSYLWPR